MNTTAQNILNLDKSTWCLSRLGDLAFDVNERVANLLDSTYDRFVGLGHFVSGDLKIKEWKNTEGLVSSAKAFKAGDILFARRNAYLKRASMVDFDGVCSGDAFVLRENHDKITTGFLAFILNSDSLWRHANSNAAGTMSKRVKWRDLANYEFLLPPKDQQAKLAELLWAADALLETQYDQINSIKTATASVLKEEFNGHSGLFRKLGEAGQWKSGGTPSRKNPDFWGGDIPWVSPKDMKVERIADSQEKITTAAIESKISTLPLNTILIVVRGLILNHSFPVAITRKEVAFNQDMKALIASEEFDPFYILYFLQHMKDVVLGITTTTTHGTKRLASDAIFGLNIPCPSIDDQQAFTAKVETLKVGMAHAKEVHASTRTLLKSLINQIF